MVDLIICFEIGEIRGEPLPPAVVYQLFLEIVLSKYGIIASFVDRPLKWLIRLFGERYHFCDFFDIYISSLSIKTIVNMQNHTATIFFHVLNGRYFIGYPSIGNSILVKRTKRVKC